MKKRNKKKIQKETRRTKSGRALVSGGEGWMDFVEETRSGESPLSKPRLEEVRCAPSVSVGRSGMVPMVGTKCYGASL